MLPRTRLVFSSYTPSPFRVPKRRTNSSNGSSLILACCYYSAAASVLSTGPLAKVPTFAKTGSRNALRSKAPQLRSSSSLQGAFITSREVFETNRTQRIFTAAAGGRQLVSPQVWRGGTCRMSSSSVVESESTSHDGKTSTFRVALCQFHVTHDKVTNLKTASEFLQRAKEGGADIAVLPEIWNGPYSTSAFPEYAEAIPSANHESDSTTLDLSSSPSVQMLLQKAQELNLYIIGGSISERVASGDGETEEKIYNTCLCVEPSGTILAKHRKVHLFDIDVPGKITFRESDTLSPGDTMTSFVFPPANCRIGVGICYDIRFPELAHVLVEDRQCQMLVFPGAFNMVTGPAHWELLQRARAVDGQCYVLTCSPARSLPPEEGDEESTPSKYPHYTAWGHSTGVAPWGDVVATCDEDAHVVFVDVDMEKVAEMRRNIPTFTQKRNDLYRVEDLGSETTI